MRELIIYDEENKTFDINNDEIKSQDFSGIFSENTPFPHVVIPNAVSEGVLDKISEEVDALNPGTQKNFYGSVEKFTESSVDVLPKNTQRLLVFLNSSKFLKTLSQITNIDQLIPDPNYEGGGVHKTYKNGFLKVHTDFNWNVKLKAYRRINAILYLNKNWKEEYGGECEFWSYDRETEVKKVQPTFNSLVIFGTNDFTFHGHPYPLTPPDGRSRNSLAVYYYTKDKDPDNHKRKSSETVYKGTKNSEINPSFFDKIKRHIPPVLKRIKNKHD